MRLSDGHPGEGLSDAEFLYQFGYQASKLVLEPDAMVVYVIFHADWDEVCALTISDDEVKWVQDLLLPVEVATDQEAIDLIIQLLLLCSSFDAACATFAHA